MTPPDPIFDPFAQQPINEVDLTLWDRIDDLEIGESERIIFNRIRDVFDLLQQNIRSLTIQINLTAGIAMAYQELTTAGTNLSTRANANDTLVTASAMPLEFDWQDNRRISSIMLSPDRGVAESVKLDSQRYNIEAFRAKFDGAAWSGLEPRPSIFQSVAGEPTKLTLWGFRPDAGVSETATIPTGRTVHLWQIIPGGMTKLT